MTSLLFLIILIMSGIYIMLNFLMENYVLSFINTRLLIRTIITQDVVR